MMTYASNDDDFYFPWRTADDLTHVSWIGSSGLFAGRYTACEPRKRRRHAEGQGIGGAVITCVRCVAMARSFQIALQVHDELLLDVPAPPTPALPGPPIALSIDADLGKSW